MDPSTDKRERINAAKRLQKQLPPNTNITVTGLTATWEPTLREVEAHAQRRRRNGILIHEHRPRKGPSTFYASTLLSNIQRIGRLDSLEAFLTHYEVHQVTTSGLPTKKWGQVVKAAGPGETPILVHLPRGARNGVVFGPLHWFFNAQGTPDKTTGEVRNVIRVSEAPVLA